jgi:hypothetical protein
LNFTFLPALVRMYNAGLCFALLLLFLFLGRTHCSKYCIFVQFHHAFSILLHHCIQPCQAALRTLARSLAHACPAALPGSLARACPAAFRALARQPCARLPGSCCPDKSEQVQQNITPDTLTGYGACALSLHNHRTVLQWQVTKLNARAAVLTGLNLFLVQFHHAFIICMCTLLSSRQVQTCSVFLM